MESKIIEKVGRIMPAAGHAPAIIEAGAGDRGGERKKNKRELWRCATSETRI